MLRYEPVIEASQGRGKQLSCKGIVVLVGCRFNFSLLLLTQYYC